MIVVLSGGVGAARFLRGLVRVVAPQEIIIISNTGDDFHVYGTHVSPDLDIVCYTLAGIVDDQRGYGIAGDSFQMMERMRALNVDAWFTLGDTDFATCAARAAHIAAGGTPSQFAQLLAARYGVAARLIPMTDDPVETHVQLSDGSQQHFQQWWVRDHAEADAKAVHLVGAEHARPAPGVLEAIASASAVLIAPSNPVVSIGTILSVPGIRDALRATDAPVVGVCPIISGAPVRGMADRLLPCAGVEVSCEGVAFLYRDFLDGFVIDLADADHAAAVARASDARVEVAQTMMRSVEDAAALAKFALTLAERL